MASGNETKSFGRGGRGAALLAALAEMSQKPGQMEREITVTDIGGTSEGREPGVKPMGRGLAAMKTLIEQQKQQKLPSYGRGFVLNPEQYQPQSAADQQHILAKEMSRMEVTERNVLKERAYLPTVTKIGTDDILSTSLSSDEPPKSPCSASGDASDGLETGRKPAGRGLAAMKALLDQQKGPSYGRGFVLNTPQYQPHTAGDQQPPPTTGTAHVEGTDKSVFKERVRLPTVSKTGTDGTPVNLSANYVRIHCKHVGVYQYHINFTPAIDNHRLRMKLLAEHKDLFKTVNSFDGSILYQPFKLPEEEFTITSIRKTDGAVIAITVTFIKAVPPQQCCHLYNVVFRRIMHILEMCPVGRYYYNPHTPATVPQHKLEVWPGYITAIHEEEGGVLLLLDASHKVLRTETVLDIMEKAARTNPQAFQGEILKRVVGCTVLTRYNNKTYRVDDIVMDRTPMDRFECQASGESMSFMDYYKKQYNIHIQNHTQPLLLHKRKPLKGAPPNIKPNPEFLCLIPELCYMTGLTDDIRQQFTVMKDLSVHTRVTPAQRQFAMKKFIHSVNNSPEARAELAIWGLELDSSTVSIAGRQLPLETIVMGKKEFSAGPQADWSRELARNELISPVDLVNWGLFYTRKDSSKANDFVRHMQAETRNLGISCQAPFRRELVNEKIETLVQELRNSINEKVQLVVVINPTNRDDRYAAIKKVCCVESPVPSQVIVAKTISRQDKIRSVVQKIALQINCKLGGELWGVKIPLQKLMVVGIDTYHDSAKGKNSIGGFVASMNQNCTRWYSNVCIQRPGQELVSGLQICLTNALRKYHLVNHFLPEKIVIYRDGVGDGQLDVLADYEIKQLQRCFSTFGQYTPQCSTLCVQKRINTRIFRKERDGEMTNPPPGIVVDNTVTRRDRYDFFIVSQHVRQGTVSPTHYIVVEDGLNLKPDHMQRLTYKMTHLYYNWPGTVRVPAPCQYAHKLAYLVGESIHREPAECLSDRLFFL